MRWAIVSSSLLYEHGRWDVGYYLGYDKKLEEALHVSEEELEHQKKVVERRRKELEDEMERLKRMNIMGVKR